MSRRILLIDDDLDDRELFSEALETIDASMICDSAASTDEGISVLEAYTDELPLIIFLDINLPGISCWEFLTFLKNSKNLKDIPVIIYSTTSHEREKGLAKEFGALTFISKPHSFEDLIKMIRNIVDHIHRNAISELGGR